MMASAKYKSFLCHLPILAPRYAEAQMISLVAAERATGAWNWLRDEGLLIVAITSGAFFFTRAIGLVSNFQAECLKRQRAAADPLDHNAIGGYQGALLGAARWGINFTIATVAFVETYESNLVIDLSDFTTVQSAACTPNAIQACTRWNCLDC